MSNKDSDTAMRLAAFAHIRRLNELRDGLTAGDLAQGFQVEGARIPLINPQRGIFQTDTDEVPVVDQDRVSEAGRSSLVRRSAGSTWTNLCRRRHYFIRFHGE